MYFVGDIKSMVPVTLNENLLAHRGYRIDVKALPGNLHFCCTIQADQVERMIFSPPSSRVIIDLIANKLPYVVNSHPR